MGSRCTPGVTHDWLGYKSPDQMAVVERWSSYLDRDWFWIVIDFFFCVVSAGISYLRILTRNCVVGTQNACRLAGLSQYPQCCRWHSRKVLSDSSHEDGWMSSCHLERSNPLLAEFKLQ